MEFNAESVQGVIFLNPTVKQDDALGLWSLIFPGETPDGFQKQSNSPALNTSASGDRFGFTVNLNTQVGRIDLSLSPTAASFDPTLGPPVITDVPAAATQLGNLLKRLAVNLLPVRVAIVLNLVKLLSPGEVVQEVIKNLPAFPIPDGATDVMVQFNVRTTFPSLPDLEMNRLCAWNQGEVILFNADRHPSFGTTYPFLGMKIDVNTIPQKIMPDGAAAFILDDLLIEALAIADAGITRFN